MTPNPEPMTDERLAEIDERAAHLFEYVPQTEDADRLAGHDVPALLAEVERLRTELVRWEGHDAVTATLVSQVEQERDNARADVKRLSAVAKDLQNLVEELRTDWKRVDGERAEAKAERDQALTAITYLQGPEECLERECEEYFGDDGEERPGVEYCSHLKAKRLSVDEHLAVLAKLERLRVELDSEYQTAKGERSELRREVAAVKAERNWLAEQVRIIAAEAEKRAAKVVHDDAYERGRATALRGLASTLRALESGEATAS